MTTARNVYHMLADDILIADGGVDDWEHMSDAELHHVIANSLPYYVRGIIDAAHEMKAERAGDERMDRTSRVHDA